MEYVCVQYNLCVCSAGEGERGVRDCVYWVLLASFKGKLGFVSVSATVTAAVYSHRYHACKMGIFLGMAQIPTTDGDLGRAIP